MFTRYCPRMFPLPHERVSTQTIYHHREISVVPDKNKHVMARIRCQQYINTMAKLTTWCCMFQKTITPSNSLTRDPSTRSLAPSSSFLIQI
ncbi:predicted protein [Lichtheimia corymbifera JMRC:FSU:9682]|uniref:Uncharacterized protein n=1 Tax=Lichtheimia corymbifera JMRC:FSU:9682 TaxID=1263082 RepID=A0A068RM38_9FUNG|nr:predicted protein [Lichtheimia corymbifera JMRC:FSU:9682]